MRPHGGGREALRAKPPSEDPTPSGSGVTEDRGGGWRAPGRIAGPSVSPMNLGLGSAQAASQHGALCCSHVQIRVGPQAEAWCMVTARGSLMFTASGSSGP